MDALTGLIRAPRAHDAFLLHVSFDPPWSLRIEDEAPLTLIAMLRGSAWIRPDDDEATLLGAGDVALVRGPTPYTLADEPDRPHRIVVGPDQQCTTLGGEDLAQSMALGVRTWGNAKDGATRMLVGTWGLDSEVGRRLLDALPGLATLRAGEWDSTLVPLLTEEMSREQPGQEAILDRLLDLLLVTGVRAWLARPESGAPGWVLAAGDPAIARALGAVYDAPGEKWTVDRLATIAGMSRAGFSRRFAEVVGTSPMAFVTDWRLTLAADLLCEPGETLASVAAQVGYANAFALSNAFKRVRGQSPKAWRASRLA